jgi:hypothetical protein
MTSSADLTIKTRLRMAYSGPEQPHEAFANLRDEPEALEAFSRRYGPRKEQFMYGSFHSLAPRYAKQVYSLRYDFRRAWRGEQDALEWVRNTLKAESFTFSTHQRQIVMEPKSLLGTIFLLFLRDYAAGKTAICANPDCHSPYFIRKRRTQKYCTSGPCTEQAQREQKRLWWERNHGKGTK